GRRPARGRGPARRRGRAAGVRRAGDRLRRQRRARRVPRRDLDRARRAARRDRGGGALGRGLGGTRRPRQRARRQRPRARRRGGPAAPGGPRHRLDGLRRPRRRRARRLHRDLDDAAPRPPPRAALPGRRRRHPPARRDHAGAGRARGPRRVAVRGARRPGRGVRRPGPRLRGGRRGVARGEDPRRADRRPRPPARRAGRAGPDMTLPPGLAVALDRDTAVRSGGRVATGGAPWRVVRLADAAGPHLEALRRAGPRGLADPSPVGRALARRLLDLGIGPPVPAPRPGPHDVTVVIPAFGRADELERCLTAVKGQPVIVVDDGSPDPAPLRRAAEAHGARLVRHPRNRDPAAARNTGLRLVETPLEAFVDSDCRTVDGCLDVLVPHFDDPRAGAVAPRVVPDGDDGGRGAALLASYETARSALDMGALSALVRPGRRLGFVPTATLLVRVAAVEGDAFDEDLRLGEDVDFVWRLNDLGWHVRYEPAARVAHTGRLRPAGWARRRHEYGTSAADLARRHPGRLAPARPSAWNLAALGLLARGRPGAAAACAAMSAALLARR